MQMIYRARSFSDACGVRDLLAKSGIAAHIADTNGSLTPDFINVSVDNRRVDAARRALAGWRTEAKGQE